jgi:hypothetical protein
MSAPIRCFFLVPTEERRGACTLYRRVDTGELMTLSEAPVGAMWFADWYRRRGPDGHYLIVRTPPGHDWAVDSRCSNCDKPTDEEHRCWVRHGAPPDVNVDKDGLTCGAGAGSLGVWNSNRTAYVWHGFLRNGFLVEC